MDKIKTITEYSNILGQNCLCQILIDGHPFWAEYHKGVWTAFSDAKKHNNSIAFFLERYSHKFLFKLHEIGIEHCVIYGSYFGNKTPFNRLDYRTEEDMYFFDLGIINQDQVVLMPQLRFIEIFRDCIPVPPTCNQVVTQSVVDEIIDATYPIKGMMIKNQIPYIKILNHKFEE